MNSAASAVEASSSNPGSNRRLAQPARQSKVEERLSIMVLIGADAGSSVDASFRFVSEGFDQIQVGLEKVILRAQDKSAARSVGSCRPGSSCWAKRAERFTRSARRRITVRR